MRETALFTSLLVIFLFFLPQTAQPRDTAAIVKSIRGKYASINDFQSEFTQETLIASMDEKILSLGRVWFKKPAMMKWQYEKPWKDRIVSDGKKVWYLNSRENQVTETAIDKSWNSLGSHTILSVLEDIDSFFDISRSERSPDSEGNILLDLKQKDLKEARNVTIAVAPKTHMLRKIIIGDVFGNTTVIKLGDAEINRGIPDSLFTLEKPEGARILTFP